MLLLYTFEPEDLAHPTTSNRHLVFRWQAWTSLCAEVNALGWPVETAVLMAPALEVLKLLHNSGGISTLYSYEETGLAHTFRRDKEIACWTRDNGVHWHEHRQQAAHRGLKHRAQWANDWHKTMHCPVTQVTPGSELERFEVLDWPLAWRCTDAPSVTHGMDPGGNGPFQNGGEREAHRYLKTFFEGLF